MRLTYREFMMALCIWREARGESAEGKVAVGEVIRNRAEDHKRRWPRSISEVVLQPWQFSSFNLFRMQLQNLKGWTLFKGDPNVKKFPKEDDAAWEGCCLAARNVVRGSPETTRGANHYHTKAVSPRWARKATPVARIGAHLFYKF